MRRGVGISGLQRKVKTKEAYGVVGASAESRNREHLKALVSAFREHLEHFAEQHRDTIRANGQFRAKFMRMCLHMGVDPLRSQKGFWAQLLGISDFYYEIGIQVIECCMQRRSYGGLVDIECVHSYVRRRRGLEAQSEDAKVGDSSSSAMSSNVSIYDIIRSISKLKVLGNGFAIVNIGSRNFVRSLPRELATDENEILEMASSSGYVSEHDVVSKHNWSKTRFDECMKILLDEGLAMVDVFDVDNSLGEFTTFSSSSVSLQTLYWFPCLGLSW